jgi:hypothetical protein
LDRTAARRGPRIRPTSRIYWFEAPYDSWSRIAGILQVDNGYDLHQTARLYSLVNMVVADGLVAGWYWKRQYAFWRPISAIQEADSDGNPSTAADPDWRPLRNTPTHPDHPSTHSVTGGAAAEVLRRFFRVRPSSILHDHAHRNAGRIDTLLRQSFKSAGRERQLAGLCGHSLPYGDSSRRSPGATDRTLRVRTRPQMPAMPEPGSRRPGSARRRSVARLQEDV